MNHLDRFDAAVARRMALQRSGSYRRRFRDGYTLQTWWRAGEIIRIVGTPREDLQSAGRTRHA